MSARVLLDGYLLYFAELTRYLNNDIATKDAKNFQEVKSHSGNVVVGNVFCIPLCVSLYAVYSHKVRYLLLGIYVE